MCDCNPEIKTPRCGAPGCEWPKQQAAAGPEDDAEIVRRMTAAMREADATFERTGGGTRHHVRGCLLPILAKHGLKIDAF